MNERIWSGYSSGIQAECYKENYICLDRYLRQKKGTILKNIKDVIIVGTDNLAKEVYQWLKDENKIQKKWFIQGFIDDNKVSFNDEINDCDIIDSMEYFNDENLDVFVILAIEKIEDIKKYSKQLTEKNVTCCSYAHPLSQFGKNIKLGVGCLCGPNSHVANSVVLGDYVHIFSSTIERGCAIGDYTLIDSDSWIGANVIIGKNVIVGAKTTIMPNIRVADYSIISPGSIIVKDILGATNDEE